MRWYVRKKRGGGEREKGEAGMEGIETEGERKEGGREEKKKEEWKEGRRELKAAGKFIHSER